MKKHSPTQAKGYKAEKVAADFLINQGFKIIRQNYSNCHGEIDLIMESASLLIFVEVRQRKKNGLVSGSESINSSKQKKIIKVAMAYLQRYSTLKPCRFDVVAISKGSHNDELEWIKDAFWAS